MDLTWSLNRGYGFPGALSAPQRFAAHALDLIACRGVASPNLVARQILRTARISLGSTFNFVDCWTKLVLL
jgi:hypothetical protein